MKKILIILFTFITLVLQAQPPQRYDGFKPPWVLSDSLIPKYIPFQKVTSFPSMTRLGLIQKDTSLYFWTGTYYMKMGSGGGSSITSDTTGVFKNQNGKIMPFNTAKNGKWYSKGADPTHADSTLKYDGILKSTYYYSTGFINGHTTSSILPAIVGYANGYAGVEGDAGNNSGSENGIYGYSAGSSTAIYGLSYSGIAGRFALNGSGTKIMSFQVGATPIEKSFIDNLGKLKYGSPSDSAVLSLGQLKTLFGHGTVTAVTASNGLASSGGNIPNITPGTGFFIPTKQDTNDRKHIITRKYLDSINTTGGIVRGSHIIGITSAPTITAGVGAGTSPTVSVSNATDLSGIVNVTTGTVPTAASVVATITFNIAYGQAPNILLTPGNAATALLSGVTMVYVTSTTTTFVINAGSTGLVGSTAYVWYYHCLQ